MTALHYRSLSDVCRRIKSGELTATAVTESILARIADLDGELHSYARVLTDSALAAAARLDREREQGLPPGLLHGVPVAVKDLLDLRGVPTASGTRVMDNRIADHDSTIVSRLQQAGAVIVGKAQLTEGAFGAHHPDIPAPVNPWNRGHWSGVSSSGSAVAVASGMAFGALGSDTGGSIRFPSASCGLVGLKPTYGRVSRAGGFPLAESLDHFGPMCRSVEDAARMLLVLAGPDPRDPTSLPDPVPNYPATLADALSGMRIGVDWNYVSRGVDAAVVDTVREALAVFRDLGVQVREVTMPDSTTALIDGWMLTCGRECADAHARYYPARKSEYGPVLSGLIELGLTVTETQYQQLEQVRAQFREAFNAVLDQVDVMIAPCMPMLPPPLEEMQLGAPDGPDRAVFITFTAPFDYSGHPALTLPAGLADARLPKAFQLIGRHLGEPALLRLGAAYERRVPPVLAPLP